MYYQIADLVLFSTFDLPSFSAFACEPAAADVSLRLTDELPPEGREIETGRFMHRILPDGWYCHVTGSDREGLFISRDYTVLRYRHVGSGAAGQKAELYLRMALECLLARRGCLSLHAAAVELDGAAYAFTGPSGIGKSTRARTWIKDLGARLISGDRPLIRVDTMELFGVPWDGKEQCFRQVRLPLKAICEVRRGDRLLVRKLSGTQGRRLLVQQSFLPMWDTETAVLQMNNVFRLASSGRILRVTSSPSAQDAERLRAMIESETYHKEVPDMKAKSGFILREVAGEYLLMPTGENIGIYSGAVLLNSVSAFVWEKLQLPTSRSELLAAVLQEFEVDEARAAADLDVLLEKLNRLNLIENDQLA